MHAKRVLSVDENVLYRPPETMEGVKEMKQFVGRNMTLLKQEGGKADEREVAAAGAADDK